MQREKILIVEDDKDLTKILTYNLEKEGYHVATAPNGEAGLAQFEKEKPSLVVLDVMMPRLNGFDFCRTIRRHSKTPILILTAKTDEVDRVLGLELGADDYVTKPFSVRELLARVKAILRRVRNPADPKPTIQVGTLEMDLERYEVRLGGKEISLSSKEFEFLKYLVQAKGRVLSRDQLLEKIWGYDRGTEIDTRTVDQHIARLRDKLEAEASRIVTVKNVGYKLKMD